MQGMNLETYLKMMNQDMASFRNQFKETAQERVRIQLVLEEISKVEKIEASDKEIEEKIEKMAENYSQKAEEFKKNLKEDDTKYIAEEVRIQKVANFLTSNAKIKEIEVKEENVEPKKEKKTKSKKTVEKVQENSKDEE